jgi:hypothetical protein
MADDRKVTPASTGAKAPATASPRAEIDAFIKRARTLAPPRDAGARGRLIFALDATMSRQPTWDIACGLQADMFREAAAIGGLDVQLLYFRGLNECAASGWVSDGEKLANLMTRISVRGGHTQIGKVLAHARRETEKAKVQALVYVGDAMEEAIDGLSAAAGQLGLLGVRPSCSRRATTRSPSRPSARSRGSPTAPIAASISAQHTSWASFSVRRPSMRLAASRRLPISRRAATLARGSCSRR